MWRIHWFRTIIIAVKKMRLGFDSPRKLMVRRTQYSKNNTKLLFQKPLKSIICYKKLIVTICKEKRNTIYNYYQSITKKSNLYISYYFLFFSTSWTNVHKKLLQDKKMCTCVAGKSWYGVAQCLYMVMVSNAQSWWLFKKGGKKFVSNPNK